VRRKKTHEGAKKRTNEQKNAMNSKKTAKKRKKTQKNAKKRINHLPTPKKTFLSVPYADDKLLLSEATTASPAKLPTTEQ
jgi:hypothetical protein